MVELGEGEGNFVQRGGSKRHSNFSVVLDQIQKAPLTQTVSMISQLFSSALLKVIF